MNVTNYIAMSINFFYNKTIRFTQISGKRGNKS